jgi:hypothetical protein
MAAAIIQNGSLSFPARVCVRSAVVAVVDRLRPSHKEGESYGANKDRGKHAGFGHCPEMPSVSWNGKGLGWEQGHVS